MPFPIYCSYLGRLKPDFSHKSQKIETMMTSASGNLLKFVKGIHIQIMIHKRIVPTISRNITSNKNVETCAFDLFLNVAVLYVNTTSLTFPLSLYYVLPFLTISSLKLPSEIYGVIVSYSTITKIYRNSITHICR